MKNPKVFLAFLILSLIVTNVILYFNYNERIETLTEENTKLKLENDSLRNSIKEKYEAAKKAFDYAQKKLDSELKKK